MKTARTFPQPDNLDPAAAYLVFRDLPLSCDIKTRGASLISHGEGRCVMASEQIRHSIQKPFSPRLARDAVSTSTARIKSSFHRAILRMRFFTSSKARSSSLSVSAREGSSRRNSRSRPFLRRGFLAGQPLIATATSMTECEIMRLQKGAMIRVLHDEPAFSEMFVAHLLARTIRVEEDLVDQLFNSSEKRLARALLLLANFGKEGRPEPIIAKVSQETLAEMIGTTRSRVSHFMNKFRELGFIDYNGSMEVHSSLLSVVLHDQPQIKKRT